MVSHCKEHQDTHKCSWSFKVSNQLNDFTKVFNYSQLIFRTEPKEIMEKKKIILPARLNLGICWKTGIPTLRSALVMAVGLFIYSTYYKCPPWKLQRFDENVQKSNFYIQLITWKLKSSIVVNRAIRHYHRLNYVFIVLWWPLPLLNCVGARFWW